MKVLFIDDDTDDTDVLCRALKEVYFEAECLIANDGLTALKILRSEVLPDVIFLDIRMPRMSGKEILLHIKNNYKLSQIPIVIYSSTIHSPQIDEYKKLGADDVIKKQVKFEDVCKALQMVIKKFI
jgi:CheY-like chemotaxis protein